MTHLQGRMARLSLQTMPFIYSEVDDLLKINLSDGTLAWTYDAFRSRCMTRLSLQDAVYLFREFLDAL